MAKFSRNITVYLFTFLISSFPLYSQSTDLKYDVLPVVTAQFVFHDSFGFIWIGTYGGLLRYDGYDLKQYSNIPFDSTSLSNNWVMAINEDTTGNLWIGTFGGGLNYFDRRTEVFKHFNSRSMTNMSNMITKIIVNENGSLWLGSITNGLVLFRTDQSGISQVTNFPVTAIANENNNAVFDIYEDKEGIIWIASATEGLIKFNPTTEDREKYKHDPKNPKSISFNTVSCIAEDDSGNLWLGTGHPNIPPGYGRGLNMFYKKTGEFKHFVHDKSDKTSICSNTISSLLVDKKGTLWIGSWDNYLNSVSIKDLLLKDDPEFVHNTNLARDMIISLYEDRLNNIWIGVFGMELYKIDRQRNTFAFYSRSDKYPDCLTHSDVSAICVGQSGKVLFGTRGLDIYNPETDQFFHYYSVPEEVKGLNDNFISAIKEDNEGLFWIATRNGGINIFNPETRQFSHLPHNGDEATKIISNAIQCLLKRPNGDFWIATAEGKILLYEQKTGLFCTYELGKGSERNQTIYALCEDRNGVLWVGTMYSGMYSLKTNGNKVIDINNYRHNLNKKTSLSNNWVSDIIQPEVIDTNALWIATNIGLNRFDLKTKLFTHFFHNAGLASDLVLRILEDNRGNIWCATMNGLSVYDMYSGNIKSYGKGDGMPFTDFSNIGQNAAKSPEGQLFFSGTSGALSFMPNQLTNNPNIPPIILTDFKIFHESIKLDTTIQFKNRIFLAHSQNAFSFDFAALNFTNPEKNQYKYKMEGLHNEWINIGNNLTVSFTNLDQGEYVFHVKGSNNHGIWNEEGTSQKVIILPPWWRTNFAYMGYLLLIGIIIWGIWRIQTNRLKMKQQLAIEQLNAEKLEEVNHLKSHFFANISHEFRTPLTLILGPLDKLISRSRHSGTKNELTMMQRNARRLLQLINQLLDLSRLESGGMKLLASELDIVQLTRGYVQSFESLANRKKIKLDFKTEPETIPVFIDRDKYEKILYNLLSNAFKFTPHGGEIGITIQFPKSQSQIPISKSETNFEPPIPKSQFVQIAITNSGPVIPSDKLRHIFDRFYQADDSGTRNHEGSGIGLALTKELVELHHGQINVESTLENGITFNIQLPLGHTHLNDEQIALDVTGVKDTEVSLSTDDTETEIGDKPAAGKKSPLILIVEDNADVRTYIRSHLDGEFQIIEAADGKIGLKEALNKIPDLIISDVMMPGMDGFALCKKLKGDERTGHIPLILLTARAALDDKIDGLETGADDYLIKPFEARELQVRIRNLISQRENLRDYYAKHLKLSPQEQNNLSLNQTFIHRAVQFIEQHLSDAQIDVSQFARELNYSHSQLTRKLEALTGMPPSRFIRSHRLLQAKKMLDYQAGNISQIAYECGFNNLSYFSRSFKAQFGQLPSEYLKNNDV